MTDAVPNGARPAARVLLTDPANRLLLLCAATSDKHPVWLAPGGGLEDGETFEDAARRELLEETGLDVQIGRWVWTRQHLYVWNGQLHNQYERFFIARTDDDRVRPRSPDSYVLGHRWWSVNELEKSAERFAPRRIAPLFRAILQGNFPEHPIDCGI